MFWLIFIWLKESNSELSLELLRLLPLETMESYSIFAAIKKATLKTARFTACYSDHYFHYKINKHLHQLRTRIGENIKLLSF